MRIEAYDTHYSARCESCGNEISISYRALRTVMNGSVPDEVFLRRAFLCVCEMQSKARMPPWVTPIGH